MKTLAVALALFALPLAAGPLTTEERTQLLTQLEKSSKIFLASLDGVSEAQWKFKAGADRWSIAECAEHIVTADTAMFAYETQQIVRMAPPADVVKRRDTAIMEMGADRGTKVKTAEFLEPKGSYATRAEVIEAFQKGRAKIVEYVKTTQDDLRGHGLQSPAGYVDAYQFLLSLAAHGERHAADR